MAEDKRRVVGLAAAQPRAGGLVWDVVHLHAQPGEDSVAGDLLDQVDARAPARGRRGGCFSKRRAGRARKTWRGAPAFERFTSSEVYVLAPGFKVEKTDLFEARPRLRVDEEPLFQLYNAAVPAPCAPPRR